MAATTSILRPQRGHQNRLDRVHSILGLVEHDRVLAFEHLFHDVQGIKATVVSVL